MKFVLAPDKFKGSLSGFEFCNAAANGIRRVFPKARILKVPLADGGDGTIQVVKFHLNGRIIRKKVNDPLCRQVEATYVYSASTKTAYIEMAEASGIRLLRKEELDCMYATSFGTGELILDALNQGAIEIILGIGGSATNDGGMGMATALGYQFLDKDNCQLLPTGANLGKVVKISTKKVNPLLKDVNIKVACDVKNPLYGQDGAAYIYAPQKGASNKEVKILDRGLQNYAKIIKNHFGIDAQKIPGAGAAGGMGAGALVFLNGKLTSGIELIKELCYFNEALKDTDWIITGEGKLDSQTIEGKTISGVLKSAKKNNIPVAALCGQVQLSQDEMERTGLSYIISVSKGNKDIQEAMRSSYQNVVTASFEFAKSLKQE